jgi:hypothetical protein
VVSDGSRHDLTVRAERSDATAVLALHGFPGWTVETISGPAHAVMDLDGRGLLRLRFPMAGRYRLRVFYGSPPAERAGALLTAGFALVLALMLAYGPLRSRWRSRSPSLNPVVPVGTAA